ncbi:MAG: RNA polymerase sigma factor [Nocardioidaceae bacterium]
MTASATYEAIDAVWRIESARLIAGLTRVVRDVGLAEDFAQDALVAALEQWPESGVPDNPGAWLMVTAKRRAIDAIRRSATLERKQAEIGRALETSLQDSATEEVEAAVDGDVGDDLLRLVFISCHPVLATEARVALTVRLLGGLTTAEIARAFLVPESTVAQRIVRAKRTLSETRVPFEIPHGAERAARLSSVLEVLYLIFNEGYAAGTGPDLVRVALTAEAIRLARLLLSLMPDEPTVLGLLALLLLQDSRRSARIDAAGRLVLLPDQDRSRWDVTLIKEGVELVGTGLRRTPERPDAYVVQAAIAACHALAPSYDATDWDSVISWYDVLLRIHDTGVIRLNRGVAVAERDGPAAGLSVVDAIDGLDRYPWWHGVRAELLHRLGRTADAREAYERALALDLNAPQSEHLRRRMAALDG